MRILILAACLFIPLKAVAEPLQMDLEYAATIKAATIICNEAPTRRFGTFEDRIRAGSIKMQIPEEEAIEIVDFRMEDTIEFLNERGYLDGFCKEIREYER